MNANLTDAELDSIIRRELPGLEFRLNRRRDSHMVEMQMERRIEWWTYAITDEKAQIPGTMNRATAEAVRSIRRKATEDYGLTAYIEERERLAAKEARSTFARDMVERIETMRPKVPTLVPHMTDEGDEYVTTEYVDGDLPSDLAAIADWARRQK